MTRVCGGVWTPEEGGEHFFDSVSVSSPCHGGSNPELGACCRIGGDCGGEVAEEGSIGSSGSGTVLQMALCSGSNSSLKQEPLLLRCCSTRSPPDRSRPWS
jgi:hypothetical protein